MYRYNQEPAKNIFRLKSEKKKNIKAWQKKRSSYKKISEIFVRESFVYNKNKSFLNYMISKAINTVLILNEIKKVKLTH